MIRETLTSTTGILYSVDIPFSLSYLSKVLTREQDLIGGKEKNILKKEFVKRVLVPKTSVE